MKQNQNSSLDREETNKLQTDVFKSQSKASIESFENLFEVQYYGNKFVTGTLLNTEPIYNSAKEAKKAMTDLVEEIKIAVEKETGGKHPIDHVMGDCKEAEIVKEVIRRSKE